MWTYQYYELQKQLIKKRAEVDLEKLELQFLEQQELPSGLTHLLIKQQRVKVEIKEYEASEIVKLIEQYLQIK